MTTEIDGFNLQNDLRAYYRFDNPEVSRGHSLELDGSDDDITIENLESGSGSLSWSIWVYSYTQGDGWESIVRDFGSTNFQEHSGDEIGWYVSNGTADRHLNTNYSSDRWIHYTGTFSSSENVVRLYKNGDPVSEKSIQGDIGDVGSSILGSAGGTENFDGLIDDFRIYNTSLTEENVRDLYNGKPFSSEELIVHQNFDEGPENCELDTGSACLRDSSGNGVDATPRNFDDNKFNTGSGWANRTPLNRPTIRDYSGNNNTGKFYGGNNGELQNFDFNASSEWAEGIIGKQSLEFDGKNDYVSVPDSESLDINGGITVSLWAKNSEGGQALLPLGKDSVYRFWLSSGNWYFRVNNETGHRLSSGYSSTSTPVEEWNHITGVYNPQKDEVSIWINGQKEASGTDPNFGSDLQTNNQPFNIGGGVSGWEDGNFNGSLDDIRVYNKALTKSEIEKLHDRNEVRKGLVGEWNFEEGNGDTAYDTSSLKREGILNTGTLHFDGTDDRILVGDDSSLDIEDNLTVSGWIKPSASSWQGFIARRADTHDTRLLIDSQNRMFYETSNDNISRSQYTLTLDKWNHVAVVLNSENGELKTEYFLDGTSVGSETIKDDTLNWNSDKNLWLGANVPSANYVLNGSLDEVRIYNRTLSEKEIQRLAFK